MFILFLSTLHAAELKILVVDTKARPVHDAYVELLAKDSSHRVKPASGVIDQVDKEFTPLLSAVPVGSRVSFPNSDNIQHQIYSFSKTKPFDLPLFEKNESQSVRFEQAGIVQMGCNIHDWMLAFLYVYESEYFQKTDEAGAVQFSALAEGAYVLRVWSPRLKKNRVPVEVELMVAPDVNLDYTQEIKVRKKIRKKPRIEDEDY